MKNSKITLDSKTMEQIEKVHSDFYSEAATMSKSENMYEDYAVANYYQLFKLLMSECNIVVTDNFYKDAAILEFEAIARDVYNERELDIKRTSKLTEEEFVAEVLEMADKSVTPIMTYVTTTI